MEHFPMDHIVASGSWHDIGLQTGRDRRQLIRFSVNYVSSLPDYAFLHRGSPDAANLPDVYRRVKSFLDVKAPYLQQYLEGLAAGAEVPPEMLCAMNFRKAACGGQGGVSTDEGCSNLLFPDSEFGPLIGGNNDSFPISCIQTCRPDEGTPFICSTWPGMVTAWGGMNGEGLAICGASSRPLRPENQIKENRVMGLDAIGPPVRPLLGNCATIDDALSMLSTPELVSMNNYSMMERSGRGVQVQGIDPVSNHPKVVELGKDRGLCHGNFYPWEVQPDEFPRFPDLEPAFARWTSMRNGVDRFAGRYSFAAMKTILTGHDGDPKKGASVCNIGNALSMIAAPTQNKMFFAGPRPCVSGYHEFCL